MTALIDESVAMLRLGFDEACVAIEHIGVDADYQRPLSESKLRKMVLYDVSLGGTVAINRRPDGTLFCFDGRHRVEAAARTGYTYIPARIYHVTREKEARYFIELNWATLTVNPRDKFRALLVARDDETCVINAEIEACGFWVDYQNTGRTAEGIAAIDAARALCYRRNAAHGFDTALLRTTLHLIHSTWQGQPANATGYMLRATAAVYGQALLVGRSVEDTFAEKLFWYTPTSLARAGASVAKDYKVPLWRGMGEKMIVELNAKLPQNSRNRIPPLV